MARRPFRAVPGLLGAVVVALTWWRPDRPGVLLGDGPPAPLPLDGRAGWEVLGPVAALLVAAGLGAAGAALAGHRAARPLLAATGGAAVTAAALTGPVVPLADGPWFAGLVGVVALVAALRPERGPDRGGPGPAPRPAARPGAAAVPVAAVLAAVALVVLLLPGGAALPPAPAAPWAAVGVLDGRRPLRSGEAALPVALPVDPAAAAAALAELDGAPAVVGAGGILVAGPDGRSVLRATAPAGSRLLGASGGRVARLAGTALVVTGLDPADPTAVRVDGVAAASPVGDDGTVWLRGDGEASGTLRRLDLASYRGAQRLDAAYLPVVAVRPSPGAPPDVTTLLPVAGAALRAGPGGAERLVPVGPDLVVEPLLAPVCGPTALPAGDGADGLWWAGSGRLGHVDRDGRAMGGPPTPPGLVLALRAAAGGLLAAVDGPGGTALWWLPGAAATPGGAAPTCP